MFRSRLIIFDRRLHFPIGSAVFLCRPKGPGLHGFLGLIGINGESETKFAGREVGAKKGLLPMVFLMIFDVIFQCDL